MLGTLDTVHLSIGSIILLHLKKCFINVSFFILYFLMYLYDFRLPSRLIIGIVPVLNLWIKENNNNVTMIFTSS